LGEVFQVPTASAYCQARQKIQPELFRHLNEVVGQDFYELYGADHQVKLWHGHRVLGADGTYLNLPDTPETRARFSVQRNQRAEGERVQALASCLYDLRNDLGVDAVIGAKQAEKNHLFGSHWAATQPGDVRVLDRLLESVLTKPAQAALASQSQHRECQTVAQVNRAVSYVALVERVVELLADPRRSPEAV
jgi:hypothetical protein